MTSIWRSAPSDEVRQAWESKGGRWMLLHDTMGPAMLPAEVDPETLGHWQRRHLWSPVHPATGWTYCAAGWGEVVPDAPGWWWLWNDFVALPTPVFVVKHIGGKLMGMGKSGPVDLDECQWLGPCLEPWKG